MGAASSGRPVRAALRQPLPDPGDPQESTEAQAASRICRISSSTRRNSGFGARHMVRYVHA
jgi:hypothetical protein